MRHMDLTVLIVDDEVANVRLLERMLQEAGYQRVISTLDPTHALGLYVEHQPDLLLLDLHMARMDGFKVLEQFRRLVPPETFFPILVLTADVTVAARERALSSGASDFLTKPFDRTEVLLRCKNLLYTRILHRQLSRRNDELEATVYARTQELEQTRTEMLRRLALAAEYRDDDSPQHIQRIGQLSALLASALGLPEAEVVQLRRAAPLHDVGKIGLPDYILTKTGPFTPEEFELAKSHTTIGAAMLGGSSIALLEQAAQIALTHHERWDGSGYPQALSGEQIPLSGRIVAVADSFDALTYPRSYKAAVSLEEAIAEIERHSGRLFDPQVVEAFSTLVHSQHLLELAADSQAQTSRLYMPSSVEQYAPAPVALEAASNLLPLRTTPRLSSLPEPLTPREQAVLTLVAQGLTNRQIGERLYISTGTVKIHIEHIIGKLAVSDRTQAAVRAVQLGLLPPP